MKTRTEIGLELEWFVGWKLKEELTCLVMEMEMDAVGTVNE